MTKMKARYHTQDARKLSIACRKRLVEAWLSEGSPEAKYLRLVAESWASDTLFADDPGSWHGVQGLFTWQGDFGVMDKEHILGNEWPSVAEVVERLQEHDSVNAVVEGTKSLIADLQQKHHLKSFCWAVELCDDTYRAASSLCRSPGAMQTHAPSPSGLHWSESQAEKCTELPGVPLRVHVHATLNFNDKRRVPLSDLQLFACSPHVTSQLRCTKNKGRAFWGDAWQAFFYLQVRKSSTLVQGGNVRPFHDYLVNTNWVVNLWQQGKVTSETCRAIIVQCKKDVPQLLSNYDRVQKESASASLDRTVQETMLALDSMMQPCRKISWSGC